MRYILLMLVIAVFAFLGLTACQKANVAGNPETAKTENKAAPTATKENKANSTNSTGHADEHSEDAPRISLEEAKKAFDTGDVVFVDTRAETAYKTEHIKGAINIPAEAFQTRYKEVPKDKKIVTYCSWPAEHTSARAVQILKQNGYENAYALVGGTAAWKNAGFPMEQGEQK